MSLARLRLGALMVVAVGTVLLGAEVTNGQERLLPAAEPDPRDLVTAHPISTMAIHGRMLYLGGVGWIGPNNGPFAVTDAVLGEPDTTMPVFHNDVRVIVPDGEEGWYVGGDFYMTGPNDRVCLVHLLPDGSFDDSLPEFNGGDVFDLALSGDTLYVAGHFITIDEQERDCLAAIDVATGELLPWNPAIDANFASDDPTSLVLIDGTVYIGGWFEDRLIGGQTWSCLAAVDAVTGNAVGKDFGFGDRSAILDMVAYDGRLVVVGGFSSVADQPRDGIAILDVATGLPTPFAPEMTRGPWAVERAGNVLYLGGWFDEVNGRPRENLAAITIDGEDVLPLSLDFDGTQGTTLALWDLLADGEILYMAGHFLSVDSEERLHFAAVNTTTGELTDWSPRATGHSSPEGFALAKQGDDIAIGGQFRILGAVSRGGAAAIDLGTRELLDWSPDLAGYSARAFAFGERGIYISGSFDIDGATPRNKIARFDPVTAALDPSFDAGLAAGGQDDNVRCLALNGDLLHIGGHFRWPGGDYLDVATLDAATGERLETWNVDMGGSLKDLELSPDGSRLYLGGSIGDVWSEETGWVDCHNLVAVDPADGRILDPLPVINDDVHDVHSMRGGLVLGGRFLLVDDQLRRRAAIMDFDLATVREWHPEVTGAGTAWVETIAAHAGVVYLGGRFGWVGDDWRPSVAAIDVESGDALTWNPHPTGEVYDVVAGSRHVVVSGWFSTMADRSIRHLAFFDLLSLRSDVESVSLSNGGTQPLTLTPGPLYEGCLYWMLGSLDGTDPGFWLSGHHVDLNEDAYLSSSMAHPNVPPLEDGVGFLDEHGEATAHLVVPPASDPALVGITAHHAYLVIDLGRMKLVTVSNSLPLLLTE